MAKSETPEAISIPSGHYSSDDLAEWHAVWRDECERAAMYPQMYGMCLAALDSVGLCEYLDRLKWATETLQFADNGEDLIAGLADLQRRCHAEAGRRGLALVHWTGHLQGFH